MNNSTPVLAVLRFQAEGPVSMPLSQQVNKSAQSVIMTTEKDPSERFKNQIKIGQGATGKVFSAFDRKTQKRCAIKVASLEQVDIADLKREIAMHAMSNHENIVKYHEAYSFDNRIWLVMELVDGGNITDLVDDQYVHDCFEYLSCLVSYLYK